MFPSRIPSVVTAIVSLTLSDNKKIAFGHRQWSYRSHVANLIGRGMLEWAWCRQVRLRRVSLRLIWSIFFYTFSNGKLPSVGHLWRGQSLLGCENDMRESGLALFKHGTLGRKSIIGTHESASPLPDRKWGCWKGPGPSDPWMVYCYIITIWVLTFLMCQCCGLCCRCYQSSHLDNSLALGLHSLEQRRRAFSVLSSL